MDKKLFDETMERIIAGIEKAGYSPYDQLTGYVTTGQETFITRTDGARELILLLDKDDIRAYLRDMRKL